MSQRPPLLLITALFISLIGTCAAKASTLPFGLPSVAHVLATVHGKNELDTQARQVGTFDQLLAMLANSEGPRQFNPSQQSSAEIHLHRNYVAAKNSIVASVQKELAPNPASTTGNDTRWEQWLKARDAYSEDTAYVMRTFLSHQAQSAYLQAHARERAAEAAGLKDVTKPIQIPSTTHTSSDHEVGLIEVIICVAFGLFILMYVLAHFGREKGNRSATSTPGNTTISTIKAPERKTCMSCGGSGTKPCPQSQCRGGLWYDGGKSMNSHCPYCHGTGTVPCTNCGGKGYV